MTMKVSWKGEGLNFVGTANSGGEVRIKSAMDEGPPALSPLELIGVGLAGCTGMDVLSILKKKRQDVKGLEVNVDVKRAEDFPKIWTWAQVEYLVTGTEIEPQAVERAIELSRDKYCPVSNMLKEAVEIEYTYTIIEA